MELDPAKSDYRIVVSGDSISRGVIYDEARGKYALLENCYVNLMSGALKGAVRNIARFGSTLTRGAAMLAREVAGSRPDIVLLEFGGNDCDFNWPEVARDPAGEHLPRTEYAQFKRLMAETIAGLRARGIVPVLMTLPPLDAEKYLGWVSRGGGSARANILKWLGSVSKLYWWQERYNAAILKIAEETGTKFIDIRSAFLARPDFQKLLCADGIHPNAAGHRLIAEGIMAYIQPRCPFLLKSPCL